MDVNEEQLLAWMAEEFYCNGVSQVELSNKMRVSKATVSRMLKKAVRENIIKFEISVPKIMDVSLERICCIFLRRCSCVKLSTFSTPLTLENHIIMIFNKFFIRYKFIR